VQYDFVLIGVAALSLSLSSAAQAQVENPFPEEISIGSLRVRIVDMTRLPDSRQLRPADQDTAPATWARVSYVRDLPDGRRFANDSRGLLYRLADDNEPVLYANVAAAFPNAFYRTLQSGFVGFEFHPDFAANGLFYTVHAENGVGNPAAPDFIPPGFNTSHVTYHSVVTEWRAVNPAANEFVGTQRELLRVAHIVNLMFHPFGHIEFDPTAQRGDADYGLLYIGGTDLGFSNGGGDHDMNPLTVQRLDTLVGATLRIDPRSPAESGGKKGVGNYTIPAINLFAADNNPTTLGEIYAYGFRNSHRLSWDRTDGTMFASDIGMTQVEEINIVHEGGNYGWMQREGIFDNGVSLPSADIGEVYALPVNVLDGRVQDGYSYPVAMYDHDEGVAVAGGFAYHGSISALQGKFVFGDVQRGRVLAADLAAIKAADDGIPRTVAPIEEIQLYVRDANGTERDVTFTELVENAMDSQVTRADLHLSQGADGELFLTSRQDGYIRLLVAD
jgi:hypothetical protein